MYVDQLNEGVWVNYEGKVELGLCDTVWHRRRSMGWATSAEEVKRQSCDLLH